MFKKLIAGSSTAIISLNFVTTAAFAATPDVSSNISSLVSYLSTQQDASGKITGFGGETSWTIMGLSAVNIDAGTIQINGVSLVDFLKNNPPASDAVTAWERDLLAVVAAGGDPFAFGGNNYVSKVLGFANSGQIGSTTAVNDDIFGVLALISAGDSADQTTISNSVNFIITNQNVDGGWSYAVGSGSDNNDTAVAVQALKAAKNAGFTNTGLDDAINTGSDYLKSNQNQDGGWGYAGTGNSDGASTAWAIQALIGEDSHVSSGLAFLAGLQEQSGGVQYQAGFGADTFTSGYALSAFSQKAFPVKIFTDIIVDPEVPEATDTPQPNDPPTNPRADDGDEEQGDVLAAVSGALPDTGIKAENLVPEIAKNNTASNESYWLTVSLVVALAGFVVKYIVIRLSYREGKIQ
jgi:hypothetical protein